MYYFRIALFEQRLQICKFLVTAFSKIRKATADCLWDERRPLRWTLAELLDLFPPGGHFARKMMAGMQPLIHGKRPEDCRLALEFNLQVMRANPRQCALKDFSVSALLETFLHNYSLSDGDMAPLIHLFAGVVELEDAAVGKYTSAKPKYQLSRQALIAILPDNADKRYPAEVLEDLSRLSYEQSEHLQQIIAEGDDPEAVANVVGQQPRFAYGKRLNVILRQMMQDSRVASFKVLFPLIDFVNLPAEALLSLICVAHYHGREELFVLMTNSDQLLPAHIVSSVQTSPIFERYRTSTLTEFIDCIEHMAAVNDKVLSGGALYFSLALLILRNPYAEDDEMAALLRRLFKLGVSFDEEAITALERHHPAYAETRNFLIEHFQDVKEPAGHN
jgi:hypothetical protein